MTIRVPPAGRGGGGGAPAAAAPTTTATATAVPASGMLEATSPPRIRRPKWSSANPLAHIASPTSAHSSLAPLSPVGAADGPADTREALSAAGGAFARIYAMVIVSGLVPSVAAELRVLAALLYAEDGPPAAAAAAAAAPTAASARPPAAVGATDRFIVAGTSCRAFAREVLASPGVAAIAAHLFGAPQRRELAAKAPPTTGAVVAALGSARCPGSGIAGSADDGAGDDAGAAAPCEACKTVDSYEAAVARSWCEPLKGPLTSDIGVKPPSMSPDEVRALQLQQGSHDECMLFVWRFIRNCLRR